MTAPAITPVDELEGLLDESVTCHVAECDRAAVYYVVMPCGAGVHAGPACAPCTAVIEATKGEAIRAGRELGCREHRTNIDPYEIRVRPL